MTDDRATHYTLLDELDARQDEVLSELDALNDRIRVLLDEFTKSPQAEKPPTEPRKAA